MTLGQQMKRHISECLGLPALPESVLSESSPKKCAHGSSGSKSKDGGSKGKQKCQSEKSQLGEPASQEDFQTGDHCQTHAAGMSQESTTASLQHHSGGKKKAKKMHKKKKKSSM